MLPEFTADQGRILMDGSPLRIRGVNWFGFEGPNGIVDGLWVSSIATHLRRRLNMGFSRAVSLLQLNARQKSGFSVALVVRGTSPHVIARWGGTISILVQHVQGIGLIGSLDLAWPAEVTELMGYLSFDFLQVPQLSCFFSLPEAALGRANPQAFVFNYIV